MEIGPEVVEVMPMRLLLLLLLLRCPINRQKASKLHKVDVIKPGASVWTLEVL